MLEKIWEKIQAAPVITLFRHVNPDPDALGSQRGLKRALEHIFPDKQVYVLGEMSKDGFEMDQVSPDAVKQSLAILLDTSNRDRIDGKDLYELAADNIRLDHHVKVENLATLDYVDEAASATGEIVAQLLQVNGQHPGSAAAQDLYRALTADSQRFTTGNTRPESLMAGAWLLQEGADVVADLLASSRTSMQAWRYQNCIRSTAVQMQKLLFSVMEPQDYLQYGLAETDARENVFVLSGCADIQIWALFTRCADGTFAASLRSRQLEVRDIAESFGGGGHICAAGIKGLSSVQLTDLIKQLAARSLEEPVSQV